MDKRMDPSAAHATRAPAGPFLVGLATFGIAVMGAGAVVQTGPWPPWIPLALLVLAAGLAVIATTAAARWTVADSRPPASHADARGAAEWLEVDGRAGKRVIRAGEVDWVEAAGNYARLHLDGESFLHRSTLRGLTETLAGGPFVRVHKSAIVNVDRIHRIQPLPSGDAMLHLRSGAAVRMSRRYTQALDRRTGRG